MSLFKGMTSDISGTADICIPVQNLSQCVAAPYLLPSESILFSLQSAKEEFTFTNQALIKSKGENATTTRKLVKRFDYKSHKFTSVMFETAGRVDRDCELKFCIGREDVSIDVAKKEERTAQEYYKVLILIQRQQHKYERRWEFAQMGLDKSAIAMRLSENSGQTLANQSSEVLSWIETLYSETHPTCYRDVILNAFQEVRSGGKI